MTAEDAVAYTEALSRRHGLGGLTDAKRRQIVRDLEAHPDVIQKFIEEAELRIEQAAKEAA